MTSMAPPVDGLLPAHSTDVASAAVSSAPPKFLFASRVPRMNATTAVKGKRAASPVLRGVKLLEAVPILVPDVSYSLEGPTILQSEDKVSPALPIARRLSDAWTVA